MKKLAVVVFNLGGPDGPKAVRPFLFNLFNDPAIITLPAPARLALAALISTTRAKSARANYARMGGGSPLLPETEAQTAALEAVLAQAGHEARVFIAMRYWKPDTGDCAAAVKAWAPDDVILLPLYPQFSSTTTASSLRAWAKAYDGPGQVRAVCCYPLDPDFVTAHAQAIRAAWTAAGSPSPVRLLFSAHGLPEQTIQRGDPYQKQVEATAAAVAAQLEGDWPDLEWQVCYQSRVGRLVWIGPTTPEALSAAARDGRGVIVCPISFVSEHIETLVELDHDYAELAEAEGIGVYIRVPALGVHALFIRALAKAVTSALDRASGAAPGSAWRCDPTAFRHCPARQETTA